MNRSCATFGLLLLLLVAAVQASDVGKFGRHHRRALLQGNTTRELTPEEKEAEREAAALAAFAKSQERKANESAEIIAEALSTAEETVQRYLNSSNSGRLELMTDLMRNADGVAFKFALNTLSARDGRRGLVAERFAHRAIGLAIREGFAGNVARAIAYAFTIQAAGDDHAKLLEVIAFRKNKLENQETGAGCLFIKNLFTDADSFAQTRGDSMAFVAAFDSEEYLPLMECFLDACSDRAARCCRSKRGLKTGRCACTASGRCDYNIFANKPRTIWICSASDCASNQKCLCPERD